MASLCLVHADRKSLNRPSLHPLLSGPIRQRTCLLFADWPLAQPQAYVGAITQADPSDDSPAFPLAPVWRPEQIAAALPHSCRSRLE